MSEQPTVGLQLHPIVPVTHLESALSYFCNVLGFDSQWKYGEPPSYGGVSFGHVGINFRTVEPANLLPYSLRCYVTVKGIDTLWNKHSVNGAQVKGEVTLMPWGMREFLVETPFGVDLTFGEASMGDRKPKRTDLQNVTVMIAKPEPEEFRELMVAIGWGNSSEAKEPERLLSSFYGMIIARDGTKLIGCAGLERVRDSIFLISDVCVLPEYRGNGIGKRLMAGVDTWLEAHKTKGMIVFLFTTSDKVEFYRHFGYRGTESGWHGLYKFVT